MNPCLSGKSNPAVVSIAPAIQRTGILSLRTQPQGGDVAPGVVADHDPRGYGTIILLVHGYNVNQPQAVEAYAAFLDAMSPYVTASRLPPIFYVYWPGDIKILSGAAYPFEMNHVIQSAQRLAAYLGGNGGAGGSPINIHIVAHSLGNRLTYLLFEEMLKLRGALRVASYTSMASAVPASFVHPGGRFFDVAQQLPGATAQPHVLFSTEDHVLKDFFPAGETVIFEGFFPEAIGRHGKPYSGNQTERMTRYDHCNYWVGPESTLSFLKNAHFTDAPPSRDLDRTTVASRSLLPANSIDSASLASRPLASRQAFP